MRIEPHTECSAAVFTPEPGDDPEDLLDLIHDDHAKNVVLDLSAVPVKEAAQWLKAAGPQIPDTDLGIVLSPEGHAVARVLKLTAFFDWYPTVAAALRRGV